MKNLDWLEAPVTILAIGIVIVGIVWAISWGMTITEREALKNGYDIITKTDRAGVVNDYVKPKKEVEK